MDIEKTLENHERRLEILEGRRRLGPSADVDTEVMLGACVNKDREGLVDRLITAVAEQQYTLNSMGWINGFAVSQARKFQWDKIEALLKELSSR